MKEDMKSFITGVIVTLIMTTIIWSAIVEVRIDRWYAQHECMETDYTGDCIIYKRRELVK